MSETPVNHGTSEDNIHFPVWKSLIHLVIAVMSATLAPFLVCLCATPLWLVLGALSFYAPPGILQDLAETAGITSTAVLYFGGAATLCLSVQFVIFGIPTAILGWRLGWITPRSSILAGLLIGCLPYLLILPFDQSFDPNYLSTTQVINRVVGGTLIMGVLGAFEGFLFWLVWRFLSRRNVST
jgi:hypothetical protein